MKGWVQTIMFRGYRVGRKQLAESKADAEELKALIARVELMRAHSSKSEALVLA